MDLSAVFSVNRIKAAAAASEALRWLTGGLSAMLLPVSAAAGHAYVDRASIRLGKRVTRPGTRQRVDQESGSNGLVATSQVHIEIRCTS